MIPCHHHRSGVEWRVIEGDARTALLSLPARSVQCCVTSPPYFGLRDYKHAGQIGAEPNLLEYTTALRDVFREVRRVLHDDGTFWLNLGDSYDSRKSLIGVPWKVAQHLKHDGWCLRSEIIWAKPNPMPESVKDRPTKAHEQIFLLSKQPTYVYDADAIREPQSELTIAMYGHRDGGRAIRHPGGSHEQSGRMDGTDLAQMVTEDRKRNKRSVWTVATQPYAGAHFATFPPKLIEPCILAGCPEGGTVLDPFAGAGTTGVVALRHGRSFIGVELNPEYAELARRRICDDAPLLNTPAEVAA